MLLRQPYFFNHLSKIVLDDEQLATEDTVKLDGIQRLYHHRKFDLTANRFKISAGFNVPELRCGGPRLGCELERALLVQHIEALTGAGIIKQAVVSNAMAVKDTGLLAKSIKVHHARYRYPGTLMATVGPTHMKRMMRRTKGGKLRTVSSKKTASWRAKGATLVPYDPGNYGHLVEYGTKPHMIKAKSKKAMKPFGSHPFKGPVSHPGTQGIGFMRRAVDANARRALQKVNTKLLQEINKLAAKHRPRASA